MAKRVKAKKCPKCGHSTVYAFGPDRVDAFAACVWKDRTRKQCSYISPMRPWLSPETRRAFAACRRALTAAMSYCEISGYASTKRTKAKIWAAREAMLKAEGKERGKK